MISKRSAFLTILTFAILAFAVGHRLGSEGSLDTRLRAPLAEAGPRLARILTIPDAAERTTRLLEIFDELGPADLPAVEAAYGRAMPFVDPVAMVLLAEWWTRFDPEGAFRASGKWPLNDPNLGLHTVIRAWARRDPVAARLHFEGIEQPVRRDAALRALAQGWSDFGDEEGLARYLEGIPDSGSRQQAMQVFVSAMVARRGVDATLEYAETLPDDSAHRFKLQIFRRVATAVTQVDPTRGSAWALHHADGPFGDTLLRRVATAWVRMDPESAMAWLRGLPEGQPRDVAMREGFRQWLMDDRTGALAWVRKTGVSPELDPALELFASATGYHDPTEGLDWAARIRNADLRERATVNVGRMWMARDQEAAEAWLETSDLPAPWKQRIMSEAKQRRVPQPG
jgi:hypothetical protein